MKQPIRGVVAPLTNYVEDEILREYEKSHLIRRMIEVLGIFRTVLVFAKCRRQCGFSP